MHFMNDALQVVQILCLTNLRILRNEDEKKHMEAYQMLVRTFETPQLDNMKILKILIYAKEDQLPLFDGSAKKRVCLLFTLFLIVIPLTNLCFN